MSDLAAVSFGCSMTGYTLPTCGVAVRRREMSWRDVTGEEKGPSERRGEDKEEEEAPESDKREGVCVREIDPERGGGRSPQRHTRAPSPAHPHRAYSARTRRRHRRGPP